MVEFATQILGEDNLKLTLWLNKPGETHVVTLDVPAAAWKVVNVHAGRAKAQLEQHLVTKLKKQPVAAQFQVTATFLTDQTVKIEFVKQ